MGEIVEFPDTKNLKEKIKTLRENLEELLLEKDYLESIVCENIKTKYTLLFGGLEYRLYKASCEYLRLRRKKEMIQAKKNREEEVNIKAIEADLDNEFIDYKRKLDEKISEVNNALKRSKLKVMSKDEVNEMKKLYRVIVKKLHPDLNPKITESEKELFYRATECHKCGDLTAIRLIFEIVGSDDAKDETTTAPADSLEKEATRLETLVESVQKDIEKLKSTEPYIWKVYLDDENKKNEKLNALERDIENFENAIRTQEEYIKELLGDENE